MTLKKFACLSTLFLAFGTSAHPLLRAQSTAGGAVVGLVLGPDGAAVPAANVVLSAIDTPPRQVVSAADGTFSLAQLVSGTYSIQVDAPGFASYKQPAIAIAVGRIDHLTLHLAMASTSETVAVQAAPIAFDASQTASVVNIDRDRIEELPIPSRNYLSFVLLAPQVAAANPALAQAGTPSSGGSFSFGGLRPGSNAIYLDDVNDNDEFTGGSRTQLSPEAISDFQIVNHGFAAQSGGGAGGSIDVQTRSGLNRRHGDIFTFVQNGALNGTPPLGLYPSKPEQSRTRVGLSLGGPVLHDRTFYYVAAEQETAHGQESNDLTPSVRAVIAKAIADYAPLSKLTPQSGLFPTTDQETEVSGRLDHRLSPNESLTARYAFSNTRNVNDAFHTDEQTDRSARGSAFTADSSLNASLASTFSATLLSRFSFELAQRRAVERTDATSVPGILIAGTALFGTPFSGNGRRFETHVEVADTLSLQLRGHLVTAGVRADHVALRAHVADGSQGLFAFADVDALQLREPDFYVQSFGRYDTNLAEVRLSGFVQDHWNAGHSLTFDYGLRWDENRLPAPLPQTALNLSPRLGVAWTPWKRTLVRGGFGLFFDRFQLATINRVAEFDGKAASFQVLEGSAAANLYRTGQLPNRPIAGVAPGIWTAASQLKNPYSEVVSVGVEQALPLATTLTAEYQFVRGVHMGRTTNVNLTAPQLLTPANAASFGILAPTAQQLGRPIFSTERVDPAYDAIHQFATSASSSYHGATITLNRQFQEDLQVLAGYTYSKTIDDASYDLEQPQSPDALKDERALSLQDQPHRFTLSGLWLIGPDVGDPADAAKNAHPGRWMKVLTGLEFAPIVSIATGFRSNPIVGLDSSRQHSFPFVARPFGYRRNSLFTPANINVDLRVLKMVPVKGGHLDLVAESFNILNHRNVALVNPVFGSKASSASGFDSAIASGSPRRIQFSLDYEF